MNTSATNQSVPVDRSRIGVVIPVYNRRTVLLETLPHVLGQTRQPDVLVIADDGSTDGTAEAAEDWLTERRPGFEWRVLRLPRRKAAAARRTGYEALGGVDLVAFLDSDDHWPSDFLARGETALRDRPGAGAASADRRYTDTLGLIQGRTDCRPLTHDPLGWLLHHGGGVASCTLMRAAHYEASGGWDPELETSEDTVLFCQLSQVGEWLHLPGEPVDFYLGNADQRGEANNLSRREGCMNFRWARVYETIVDHTGVQEQGTVRNAMARIWRNAGSELQKRGRLQAARTCYGRSLRWRRLQYNAARRLLKTYLDPPAVGSS